MPPTVSPSKPRRLLNKADLTVDEVESIISELNDKVARLQEEVRELKRTSPDSHREADVTKISQYASDKTDGWKRFTAGPGWRGEESRGSENSSHDLGGSHRALSRRGRGEAPAKREPLHHREAAKDRARTASEEARPATIFAPTPETRKAYISKRISRGVQYEKPAACPKSSSMRLRHADVQDVIKKSPWVSSTYKDQKRYTSAPMQSKDRAPKAAKGWESGGRRTADSPSRSSRAQEDSDTDEPGTAAAQIDDRQRYDYAGAADARGGPHRRSEIDWADEADGGPARRPRWPFATGDEKIKKAGDDSREQKKESEAAKKSSFKTKRKSEQVSDESKKTSSKTVRIEDAMKRIDEMKDKSLVVLNDERKGPGKSVAKETKKGEEKPKKLVSKERKKTDSSKEKANQEDPKRTSHETRKNKLKRLMRIDKKKGNGSNNETEKKKDVEEKISNSSDSRYNLVKRKLNDCSGELNKVIATISDLFREHKKNNKEKK